MYLAMSKVHLVLLMQMAKLNGSPTLHQMEQDLKQQHSHHYRNKHQLSRVYHVRIEVQRKNQQFYMRHQRQLNHHHQQQLVQNHMLYRQYQEYVKHQQHQQQQQHQRHQQQLNHQNQYLDII